MSLGRFLLLGVVLLGGTALANAQYKDAVKGAVQGMTLDEIIQWSNGQFRRQATIGRYVRWGGSIVLGSALIAAGLDYFYNYLRRETGTPLDQWYYWVPSVVAGIGGYWAKVDMSCSGKCNYRCLYGYQWAVYGYRFPGGKVGGTESTGTGWYDSPPSCSVDMAESWAKSHFKQMIGAPYSSWEWRTASESYKNGVPESDRSRFVSDLSWLRHVLVEPGAQPDLVTWLQQHPDAANGVKQAVTQYLTDTEPSSPSQPWPGVRLEPVPNPNQWTDNPFTRPDIDTDGDGYPDSVEWQEANRRGVPWPDVINDPTEHPDPNGDPDGDGYPTLEEVQVGTDPYDPASNPGPRRRPWIDTDGDGYPDWQEVQEGTDPKDASSRPRVAPAPNPNQPWVDTDGDGYPDWQEISEGTDPNDPESRPSVPPAPRPEENPDKVEWPGAPPAPGLKPVEWPTRSEERKALPEVDKLIQPFEDKVLQRWRDGVREIRETAERKFPFGIIAVIRGMSISREGGNCTFTFSVGPAQGTVAPCNTPIFAVAESFRPVWAGLLWVAFALALVRRGLDIQR